MKFIKMYKIGQQVEYSNQIVKILGFTKDKKACVIEGYKNGHSGDAIHYWYDDDGNPIKYYQGNDRYFVSLVYVRPYNTEINYEIY